ncbi:MAG: hypothetical protein JST92_17190 [Deltaproteobacteria bacterium]|nr:hypothetical protein [Deltaproteobacteria bacterium]
MSDERPEVGLGYAWGQYERALASGAGDRVRKWSEVIRGMITGALAIGSRTPVGDAPPWVTLEVVHGGFATGGFSAGGPLRPHEIALAKALDLDRGTEASRRAALNAHFVDLGAAELTSRLDAGAFHLETAEEGALLVLAWLLERGEVERGRLLLESISPWFERLRFFPQPTLPRPARAGVSRQTSAQAAATLRRQRPHEGVTRMNEALSVWTPLRDRAVALFLETVDGEPPRLVTAPDGTRQVEGGVPCVRFAPDWTARAQAWLADDARLQKEHRLCKKHLSPKENFAKLREAMQMCAAHPTGLSQGAVARLRRVLAGIVSRWGTPESPRLREIRERQALQARLPLHVDVARTIATELETRDRYTGVPDLDAVLDRLAARTQRPLPPALVKKALRCLEAPLPTLLARGLVSSSEVVAELLPPLSAVLASAHLQDPALRCLFERIYVAFRARRSLLLLDLQRQVRLHELPWIAAISPWIGDDEAVQGHTQKALSELVAETLRAFPQTLTPNPLVTELRALGRAARLNMPLVNEIAADIFMGELSDTFLSAAREAALQLRGSLYERYYGLDYAEILRIDDAAPARAGRTPSSPQLMALCQTLAGDPSRDVVGNGMILEQVQIVTTHNLATLFTHLDLRMVDRRALAQRTFEWICRQLAGPPRSHRAGLHLVKNCAYAWRQLVFLLSQTDAFDGFVAWARAHANSVDLLVARRIKPVLDGLEVVGAGGRFDANGNHVSTGSRRLLGWSRGAHWLLGQAATRPMA